MKLKDMRHLVNHNLIIDYTEKNQDNLERQKNLF